MSLRLVSRLGVRTLEWSCLLSSDSLTAGSSFPGRYTYDICWYFAEMKSLFVGCRGSEADGLEAGLLDEDDEEPLDEEVTDGFSREYSQMELAPHEYRLCTMVSCSGTSQGEARTAVHLTWETCLPSERWTEVQSAHSRTPRFSDAHVGLDAPQSAHTDKGCCWCEAAAADCCCLSTEGSPDEDFVEEPRENMSVGALGGFNHDIAKEQNCEKLRKNVTRY